MGAALLARFLGALLFRVRPFEPLLFASVGLVLLVVVAAACGWPARRASRVAPADVLRCD